MLLRWLRLCVEHLRLLATWSLTPKGSVVPALSRLGDSAILLNWDERIDATLNGEVHAVRTHLLAQHPDWIVEAVPAYASLLVHFDEQRIERNVAERFIAEAGAAVESRPASAHAYREHVIPVHYGGEDGPDIEYVVRHTGLTVKDVVRLHTSSVYRVYFIGFLPGFGYMGPTATLPHVPRLENPRLRVERGSVGLAGSQTGIYPSASPGGWRIIGRTPVRLWEPESDQPTSLQPGEYVRFSPTDERVLTSDAVRSAFSPRYPLFEMLEVGGVAQIQDRGRRSFAHLGLGQGGSFDPTAATAANALVANPPEAAVLELAGGGLVLKAVRPTVIAFTGAGFRLRIRGHSASPGQAWLVRAGDLVDLSPSSGAGYRGYLAAAGGFDFPLVLGSRGAHPYLGEGMPHARPLSKGDSLGTVEPLFPRHLAGREVILPLHNGGGVIDVRIVPYDGPQFAGVMAFEGLLSQPWTVALSSNRMGLRLEREDREPLPTSPREHLSFGVVPGTIQLPHDGWPIVLGPDCQTTGGYPVLGAIVQADVARLAQAGPGACLRFHKVDLEPPAG